MPLQFYAVHSEALAHTHDALQAHARSCGQRPPGPTRALRVAQLYGHIQLRAAGRAVVTLALCELAVSWRLQPRQLRQDLALLQALGWLSATGTSRGTVISLHPPEVAADGQVVQATIPRLSVEEPHARRMQRRGAAAVDRASSGAWIQQRSLPVQDGPPQPLAAEQSAARGELEAMAAAGSPSAGPGSLQEPLAVGEPAHAPTKPFGALPGAIAAVADPVPQREAVNVSASEAPLAEHTPQEAAPHCHAVPVSTTTDSETSAAKTQRKPVADLLSRLAVLYNQHRPTTWPAYHPRGNGLRAKVRQALQQAGSPEALIATFIAALTAMPPFWRTTYPQGRSGAECMAVLFATDRGCAGLGVEFWHLFSWAQASRNGGSGTQAGAVAGASANSALAPHGPPATSSQPEDPLRRARRLFLWDSGVWRGQGREALLLSLQEKRELTLLLEANGVGLAGTAARQFTLPDEPPAATEAEASGAEEAAESVPAAPSGAAGVPETSQSRQHLQGAPPDGGSGHKRKPPHQRPKDGLEQGDQPDATPSRSHQPIRRGTKRLHAVQPKPRPLPSSAAGPPGDTLRRRAATRHLQGSPPAVNARAG
jgi:hypothetical protein